LEHSKWASIGFLSIAGFKRVLSAPIHAQVVSTLPP
jgi:hypothetical protein